MTETDSITAWQHVWRVGLAPLLSLEDMEVLRKALVNDDPRLLQGGTTMPPPLACVADWPCEAGCPIAYIGAFQLGGFAKFDRVKDTRRHFIEAPVPTTLDDHYATIGEVEEFFGRMCYRIDLALGESSGCRWLLNFWDSEPRAVARKGLLEEVQRTLAERLRQE